jgi:peptidoglycan/xylan/chitin deacetylase (PgdA/CDA1 family)
MTPERRYALGALLDVLGLAGDERAEREAKPGELDEVFALLTLAHESEAELDEHGRPRPTEPPGPRVAELAAKLGRRIGVQRRGYTGGERFLVALTHDVDLLGGGGIPTALRKLAGGVVRRSSTRLRESGAFLLDALGRRDPAYPLGELLAAEREHGRRSTCFFLARQDDPHDGYPERYRPALAEALEETAAAGLEIALHASYRARDRPGGIAEEAELLGHGVAGLRHHYLRSAPERLAAELGLAGLRYDSSIGWPSRTGLRAGTPYPYRLWDPERREPGGWELPLAVMDATLAAERYLGLDAEAAYDASVAALEPVAEHGGAVALLWHPPSHHPRLSNGYDTVYRRLLPWIEERGGWAGTASETLDRWEAR